MERNNEHEIDTRLGRRCIDPTKIVHFPQGLAGFEQEREFILLQIRPEAPMLVLQSIHTPLVGLLVADPYSFLEKERYEPVLGAAEKQLLGIETLDQVAVLVTVSIPPGAPEQAALNLTGPLLINYEKRIGLQVPQNIDGPAQINIHSLKPSEKPDTPKASTPDSGAETTVSVDSTP